MFVGALAGQTIVELGTAGNYVILSEAGITTTTGTIVVGDMAVSPIYHGAITGFGTLVTTETFQTSPMVTGKIYAADFADPTPSQLTTAIADKNIAYADAAGRISGTTINELATGAIGGKTLAAGLYKWSTAVNIVSDVTFFGASTDVWVLQIAQGLNMATGTKIVLGGRARANNIFWQVAGGAILEAGSVFNGILLSATGIVMKDGATLIGRALAETAVTLIANTVKLAPTGPPVCSITLATATLTTIRVSKTYQLRPLGVDQYGANCTLNFKYTSSNTAVLTVGSTTGLAKGVKVGLAKVTVTSGLLPAKSASFSVVK